MKIYHVGQLMALWLVTQPTTLFSTTREWEPKPVEIVRSATQHEFKDIDLMADIYDVWFEKSYREEKHWEYQCDHDSSASPGNWYGYWNVSKREKPASLAAAIKGLGYTAAQRIVDSQRYFTKKPRSWNAFKDEIRAIADDSILDTPDLYYNVVVVNGRENAINLGYNAGEEICQWKEVTEVVPVVTKKRRFLRSVTKKVDVQFEGGLLLSRETDVIRAQYDGIDVIFNMISTHNEYEVQSSSESSYFLKSLRRKMIRPTTEVITATLVKENDTLMLQITDQLHEELTKYFKDPQVQVTYRVTRDAFINNDEAKGTFLMTGKSMSIDLKTNPTWERSGLFSSRPKTLVRTKSYLVKLEIQRINTSAFSSEKSPTAQTATLTY